MRQKIANRILAFFASIWAILTGRRLNHNRHGAGFIAAVVTLIGVMMATIIGAIVFFAFADGVEGTSDDANNTIADVVTYAITVFALLAIIPLIMVGGLMLRSLGFMGGGGEIV